MADIIHYTVMKTETVDALDVESRPNGTYFDVTGGGGGHSAEILRRLGPDGRLFVTDRDPEAADFLGRRFADDARVTVGRCLMSDIASFAEEAGAGGADGIVADLGLNMTQYKEEEGNRGFSYLREDAPLLMQMTPDQDALSAADIVNGFSEAELRRLFSSFGEKFSAPIARNIVLKRSKERIETVGDLNEVIRGSVPFSYKRDSAPFDKVYLALRATVNDELGSLPDTLETLFSLLRPSGVLAVISFHSAEDSAIAKKFRTFCEGCTCPSWFPQCTCGKKPRGELLFRSKVPSEAEIQNNRASRSARLRAIRKLEETT